MLDVSSVGAHKLESAAFELRKSGLEFMRGQPLVLTHNDELHKSGVTIRYHADS